MTVKPKLFLCGTDDDFTSETSFAELREADAKV